MDESRPAFDSKGVFNGLELSVYERREVALVHGSLGLSLVRFRRGRAGGIRHQFGHVGA